MLKKTLGKMKRWIVSQPTKEEEFVFNFQMFRRYDEIKDWDIVDQKALWNKLQENYFKILLSKGEFNLKELGVLRIVYRFYKSGKGSLLKIKSILNDTSCKPGLVKLNQICKLYDEKGLDELM